MKNIVLLGSTGSIGTSTLKVVDDLPDRLRVVGLAAGSNVQLLAEQTRRYHPEAVALIAAQLLEFIRDGRSVSELMDLGRRLLGRAEVMDRVPELIAEVQVEGTFADGTKLVTVHHPIV